ncbi:MAG TPA: flagellar hook-length control protein FliK [Burkholderiales bacterium]|nr:flagellar hook-length control protein FliK [Burkholderiales bacterium]
MLPLEPLGRLQLRLAPDSLLVEALSALREVLPVGQGEPVRATIGGPLPDGRQQLQVGDRTFLLRLPPNMRQGDTLELTATRNGVEVRLVTPRSASEAEAAGSQSRLSAAGRLVAELAEPAAPATRPASIAGGPLPLIDDPGGDPLVRLAQALRAAVTTSGLFYESHLAAWVAGEHTLPAVGLEPQARFAAAAAASSPANSDTPARPAPAPAPADGDATARQATSSSAHEVLQQQDSTALPPAARDLVREQLNLLESQQLVWSGLVWPGQKMEWEISGQPPRATDDAPRYTWRTKLRLELPHLGTIEAHLVWNQDRLDLGLAADPDQMRTFAQALPALRAALDSAGIAVNAIEVGEHDAR